MGKPAAKARARLYATMLASRLENCVGCFEVFTRWKQARLREDAPTMDVKPSHITLDKGKAELTISWDDGLVSRYPLAQLREACPCVECRGGHANMGMDFAPDDLLTLTPARSYRITGLSAVGNYALQPSWDDGHHTGIYTWEYLRHLSPQRPG